MISTRAIAIAAVLLATAALMVALSASAGSGGSKVAGKNGVKSSDIATGAVKGRHLGSIVPRSESVSVPAGTMATAHSDCRPGEKLLGTGYDWNSVNVTDLQILSLRPAPPFGVVITAYNGTLSGRVFTAIVTCLKKK